MKGWAVKTSRGIVGKTCWTRTEAIKEFMRTVYGVDYDYKMRWKRVKKVGYSCAKVTVTEGWDSGSGSSPLT